MKNVPVFLPKRSKYIYFAIFLHLEIKCNMMNEIDNLNILLPKSIQPI